tara:strand:- start:9 stop:806 length:798 start_codon:yes stop_codon:yes gene_type:complete
MATAEKTEIAKKKTSEVSLALDLEEGASGFEEMGQDDLALPRLKLLQKMSEEIDTVEGAADGKFYNSVTGELYDGRGAGLHVIPCAYIRQYLEWSERGEGSNAPINIFPATSDILSRTHKRTTVPGDFKDYLDNGNYIENSADHYLMILDSEGFPSPVVINMKSTQLKKSRKWNAMMMSVKAKGKNGVFTPPMFSQIYRLTSVPETNAKGTYSNWEVERVGAVEDAGVYGIAKAFAGSIKSGEVKAAPLQDENVKQEEGKTHDIF